MMPKAISSTMNVAFGTRKLLVFSADCTSARLVSTAVTAMFVTRLSPEDEDEQRHEGQVDEEHRLDQTHGQEEDGLQAALGLGLASDALDVGRAGQTVTDARADGATREGDAAAHERAGQLDRSFYCHY